MRGDSWRGFMKAAIHEHAAASPLPTRQLKRATAKEMGRLLEAKSHAEERQAKIVERRKRKAE